MGAFKGRAGDNKPHRHWAHQVSIGIGIGIGIGGTARLAAGSQVHEASALFVQAGTAHQLLIGRRAAKIGGQLGSQARCWQDRAMLS